MTLADAQSVLLMGQPGSWDGYARRPLSVVPDAQLHAARAFFRKLQREGTASPRMQEQIRAIALVLDDREAHHPQQRLAL